MNHFQKLQIAQNVYSITIKTYCTLVICCITILNAEVEGMQFNINIWKNEFFLD